MQTVVTPSEAEKPAVVGEECNPKRLSFRAKSRNLLFAGGAQTFR
jgi:hypothetical protein